MKVAIIGCGYVGLPSGVGLASLGHTVTCIDHDQAKIKDLQQGKIPLFEENLAAMFAENVQQGRLHFTNSCAQGVQDAQVVVIAVGTPPHPTTHAADLTYLYAAATELAPCLQNGMVVAIKSTVPIGTGDEVEKFLHEKNAAAKFEVVSLPEFLREGHALDDFLHPARIIAGTIAPAAQKILRELYRPLLQKTPLIFVRRRSAETIKYASNGFLAMKIQYINEIADLCEKTGGDIREVARGMGADPRIAPAFLRPGPGFGGSCFPKDTLALAAMAAEYHISLPLIDATIAGNKKRKEAMAKRIAQAVAAIKHPRVAIWGLTFKNGTDDCRESPAIEIMKALLDKNITITAYDPQGIASAQNILGDRITYAFNPLAAAQDADLLAVLTEWPSLKTVDLGKLAEVMRGKLIIDTRNILDPMAAAHAGFTYQGVGLAADDHGDGDPAHSQESLTSARDRGAAVLPGPSLNS